MPTSSRAVAVEASSTQDAVQGIVTMKQPYSLDQLYLAWRLIESKDTKESIEEHVASILASMKSGSKLQPVNMQHVDTYHYWKTQYVKAQLQIQKAEEHIALLENDHLRHENFDSNESQSHSQHQINRTYEIPSALNSEAIIKWKKRQKDFDDLTVMFSFLAEEERESAYTSDNSIYRLKGQSFRISKMRISLEKLSQSPTTVIEIKELVDFTSNVLMTLDDTFSHCYLIVSQVKIRKENLRLTEIIKHLTDQIIITFLTCFKTLDKISETILGRQNRGKIIYHMSKFYEKGLTLLHTLSMLQEESTARLSTHSLKSRSAQSESFEYAASKHVARALSTIVYNLEWRANVPIHSEVLEGILYTVIAHTSTLLSYALFDEHVSASEHIGKITTNSDARKATISPHETRYIIEVLHNCLGGNEKRNLFLEIIAAGRSESIPDNHVAITSQTSQAGENLLKAAKKLLQDTLVSTGLGHEVNDTLHPPAALREATRPMIEYDANLYGRDWYIEKVWDLIGWDLA